MTHNLNGIKYSYQLITDEELAVIKAMRKSADIAINFHQLNEIDEVDERMNFFKEIKKNGFSWIEENERTDSSKYISFCKNMNKLSVSCFLEIKKDQQGQQS